MFAGLEYPFESTTTAHTDLVIIVSLASSQFWRLESFVFTEADLKRGRR
jgi:hypothetical protein